VVVVVEARMKKGSYHVFPRKVILADVPSSDRQTRKQRRPKRSDEMWLLYLKVQST
jgi:hypothetical protein